MTMTLIEEPLIGDDPTPPAPTAEPVAKRVLLVLDNLEQIAVDAGSPLAQLVSRTPGLHLLLTLPDGTEAGLLRRAGEAFRIDAQGITHAQMVKQSFAWDEIVALQPVRMGNQPMICYEVVQARLDQLGGLRAKLAAANRSMTGCSFALAISGTDARFDDVLAALEAFAPEHLLPGD